MNKLNIAILCYPGYGGSGVVATELGLSLAERGHQIHFISYDNPFRLNSFSQNIFYHQVEMPDYPLFKHSLYSLALSSKIVDVCERHPLDIIHAHYAIPHSICGYLAKKVLKNDKIKLISTVHGTDITLVGLNKAFYKMVKFGIEESDQITCVSNYLKNETLKEFKINRSIQVIYNFIDSTRFTRNEKSECSFCGKVIMHISNFRPVKNIEGVIICFNEVLKKIKCSLVLVGDGPELSRARYLASELNIIEYIRFLGKVDQVEFILPHADVFLFPSYSESFGLAILEAMSCGIPTVSSNVGGIMEVVQEGLTGFTFEPDDHKSMANKVIEILSNKNLKNKLGQYARKISYSLFDKKKIISQYENIYYQ